MKRLTFVSLLLLLGCENTQTPCTPPAAAVPQSLYHDVAALTAPPMMGRRTGTNGAMLAADYLAERFGAMAVTPWSGQLRHPFEYGPSFLAKSGENLVAWVPGPPPYRLVVAHYDHLGRVNGKVHPGADDNASGVAVLLALAERASQSSPSQGLIFAAVDAEENGLHGSQALARQLASVPLEWVLNLDMVGRPPRDNRAQLWWRQDWPEGSQALATVSGALCVEAGRRRMKGQDGVRYDTLDASDHYPFHRAGVNWLYLGVPPHKDYHTPRDQAGRLDYQFMAGILEGSWALLSQP
ncbi:M28 family peptidase [Marinobacter hydrocarbonoclasticus]|nr:M28 family peptidase [Marinobacter nauticus]